MNENELNENIITEVLTPKQELFCVNYSQNKEFFGNGILAYANAYGFDLDEADKLDTKIKFKDGTILTKREIELKALDFIDVEKLHGDSVVIEKSTYDKMCNTCAVNASRLLKSAKIQTRCRDLVNELLQDKVIDERLTKIILEGENSDSIRAIQEYNKLRQRIVDKKDITSGGKPLTISFDPVFNEDTTQQTERNHTE
jgi:hypothetical protein